LKPGGQFVFVGHLAPAENLAPTTRIEWIFLASLHDPYYGYPSLDGFKSQLNQTGFEVSDRPQIFNKGWVVLQARKKDVL